jgi:ABC-type spermidine/putrescine transport system permease subunit I
MRRAILIAPLVFMTLFAICPLIVMIVVSFWLRKGFSVTPALSFHSYADFLGGARTTVLVRSIVTSVLATGLCAIIAYPIAYLLARQSSPNFVKVVLLLFSIPFLVNYIIRNFSLAFLLGRTGPVNEALIALGVTHSPVDWLLYSTFAVYLGLVASYMPVMVFPLWLALSKIDERLIEASYLLGASPARTFLRIVLPLSMPGLFAALIFGAVGILGESAVPLIMGGAGYELMGNTITSATNVLDYPLAAAMSTITVLIMTVLLVIWAFAVDQRSFLGQMLGRA